VTVSAKVDFTRWKRKRDDLRRTIVPDATRSAINDLAFRAQRSTRSAMHGKIEGGPTPFTRSAIRVNKARRGRPFAEVHLGPQRGYLRFVFGLRKGTERPEGAASYIYVPIASVPGHKINARGNLSGRRLGAVFERMKRQKFYWVDQGSRILVFRRTRRQASGTLVGVLVRQAQQEQQIDAERIGKKVVRRNAKAAFDKAIAFRIGRAYGASLRR